MANWGNRVKAYYEQIKSLQSQGWITPAEASNINLYKNDSQFQTLINLGKTRAQQSVITAQRQTALARVGGLPPPGNNIDDRYYQRFLGVSKQDILNAPKVAITVKQTLWNDKYKGANKYSSSVPTIADVEYVIRQRYASAYDPKYERTQLRGNGKWEQQSEVIGKYVNYIKSAKSSQINNFSGLTPAQKLAKNQRANTILKSWSKEGMFPKSMIGTASTAKSKTYPGKKSLGALSADKIIARTRPAGIMSSSQARSIGKPKSISKGTRATTISALAGATGTRATGLNRKTSTRTGTRAKKVS